MTMKAFIRFLLGDPAGQSADGRMIGLGLSTALKKYYSADEAEHYMNRWAAEHDVTESPRH
ncbi:hypothetical protein ITP53_36535 [Nonomuraea sp. K274]|uniref:Uncharacterized protein n=1 Tax=Nonomuraea cypriaca TaxID=1187855 RepID=A0A931AHF8_9ACTN|nr:hypothetical protein [Nonomuraea cypriaca]MBF8191124.1 hypothetical protein [Nonomuraea cypriaca]